MESMLKPIGMVIVAALAPMTTAAAGQFLCRSPQPYNFHIVSSGADDRSSAGANWTVAEPNTGRRIAGPKPAVVRPDGFVVIRVESKDGLAVEIQYDGKLVGSKRGVELGSDIHEGEVPKVLLTTYDPEEVVNHSVLAEQVVLGARGQVLASRQLAVAISEDSPVFHFTADGSGIYQGAAEMHGVDAIEVFGVTDFRKLSSFRFDDYSFIGVYMQTPATGFAIGESGQLFRFESGKIIPMEMGGAGFKALDIVGDKRSDRILVRGGGGYRVFGWSGKLLFAQSDGPRRVVSDAKLAIDGSVAEHDSRTGKYRVRVNDGGVYSRTVRLPLSSGEWSNIACFTPNSAALVDSEGNPRLIDFKKRR